MSEPGNRICTILDIDVEGAIATSPQQPVKQAMLGRLAARFNVSVPSTGSGAGWAPPWLSIWLASSTDGKFKGSTIEWFTDNVEVGNAVQIPFVGDEWDWRNITLTASTLDELCTQDKKKPDPLRIGGPALTPELLYFHIFNEAYRGLYTRRLSPGSRRSLDLDPGSLRFEKGDALFIPYPIRRKGMVVKATPSNGTTPSATAALAPPWVIQFYDLLNAIDQNAGELAKVNKICLSCEQEGMQAWAHIMVLHDLVRFQQETVRDQGGRPGLDVLEPMFTKLENEALKRLFLNVADVVVPDASAQRTKLARQLVALLAMDRPPAREGGFSRKELEAKLEKSPKERINRGELLLQMKDRVLARAYIALSASPSASVAYETADKVLQEFEEATKVPAATPESGSAAVGGVTSVVSTSVGNLPGPSSLGVAFIWFRTSRQVTEAAKAAGNPALKTKVPDKLVALTTKVVGFTETQAKVIQAAAAGDDPALIAEAAELLEPLAGKKTALSNAVSENFMAGPKWSGAITLVNMFSLYNTIVTGDPSLLRKSLNIGGGSLSTVLGALQVLKSLAPEGPFEAWLKLAGKPFSVLAIVTSILSGVITAVSKEGKERLGGVLQAGGGVVSLVGFAFGAGFWGFTLVAAGGVIMVASVVVSNWDAASSAAHEGWDAAVRHLGPGPKVVIGEQLRRFLSYGIVQQVGAELRDAVKAILAQLDTPRDSDLHDFARSDANVAVLRELRFAEADIDLMTYNPAFDRPLFPGGLR